MKKSKINSKAQELNQVAQVRQDLEDAAEDEAAEFQEEFPEFGEELLDNFPGDVEQARVAAREDYAGCYRSLAEFAQEKFGHAEVPESLRRYIDYEAMGRDLRLGGDVFEIKTGWDKVHVFWSR